MRCALSSSSMSSARPLRELRTSEVVQRRAQHQTLRGSVVEVTKVTQRNREAVRERDPKHARSVHAKQRTQEENGRHLSSGQRRSRGVRKRRHTRHRSVAEMREVFAPPRAACQTSSQSFFQISGIVPSFEGADSSPSKAQVDTTRAVVAWYGRTHFRRAATLASRRCSPSERDRRFRSDARRARDG